MADTRIVVVEDEAEKRRQERRALLAALDALPEEWAHGLDALRFGRRAAWRGRAGFAENHVGDQSRFYTAPAGACGTN